MNQIQASQVLQGLPPAAACPRVLLYIHLLPVVRSECAELIRRAQPGDVVVKPAFPPWLPLEPQAIELAAHKGIRIVEERDVFDSRLLVFGRQEQMVKLIVTFALNSGGSAIHVALPVIWRGIPQEMLEGLSRSITRAGIRAQLVE